MNAAPHPYSHSHFCQGVYQRTRCYCTPLWVPLSSLEQLMTQKYWPKNGCLSGMDVSHHPYNQVKPSEYHQCAQQNQGSGFTSPRDLSVELICCSGNRILVMHDSDSSQTLKTFPVLNDWLGDTAIRFIVTKKFEQNWVNFCHVSECESMCVGTCA